MEIYDFEESELHCVQMCYKLNTKVSEAHVFEDTKEKYD